MDENARAAYNAYLREWRSKNKDKVKAINARYWIKKAREIKETAKHEQTDER